MSVRTLALLLCWLSATPLAWAQSDSRFALSVRGEALASALDRFAERARLDLAYDPSLTDGKTCYCVAEDLLAEEALSCLLRGSGLDFARLSNGLYVLRPSARAPAATGSLVGVVRDATSSLGLPEASVVLAARDDRGAASNAEGQFAFGDLKPGRYAVHVSYVGYRPARDTVEVLPGGRVQHEVQLERVNYAVSPIIIDGLTVSKAALREAPRQSAIAPAAPDFDGLVGVNINHATADVHVQGGGAGEHQVTLDGAPVFTTPTLTGQIGAFSSLAVGRMRVQKAGFGVQASSNTVGIIEVDHDLSAQPGHHVDAQVDALSTGLRHRYSSSRGDGSSLRSLASARVGMWSVYAQPGAREVLRQQNVPDALIQTAFEPFPADQLVAGQDSLVAYLVDGGDVRPREPSLGFVDANAAVRWAPGPLRHLHVSGYFAQRTLETDGIFADPRRDKYTWRSGMVQSRYTTFLDDRTFASLQLRASFYRQEHSFLSVEREEIDSTDVRARAASETAVVRPNDDGNTIAEYAAEVRLDHTFGRGLSFEAGLVPSFTAHKFALSTISLSPTDAALVNRAQHARLGSFVNVRLPLGETVSADAGLRATYVPETDVVYAEPRVALRLDAPESPLGPLSARLSGGLYRQFISQYRVSSRSVTTLASSSTAWISLNPHISPTGATHAAGEVAFRPLPDWRVTAEGFYKFQHRLYTVNHATVPIQDAETPQELFLERSRGAARGVTLGVDRTTRRTHVGARYERSQAERQIQGLNPHWSPVPWNEPHRLSARADVKLGPAVLAARWTSIWERAWAYRQAYYDFLANQRDGRPLRGVGVGSQVRQEAVAAHVERYNLENPQDNRLGTFHQLDVSAAYTLPAGASRLQLRVDLLNALGRRNEVERQLIGDGEHFQKTGFYKAFTRYSLPLTTVWSVRWAL